MIHPFKHRIYSRDVQAIQNNVIQTLTEVIGVVPGADTMAYAVDDDGNHGKFWKALLSLQIDITPGWTPDFTGSLLRMNLNTIVEWYAQNFDKGLMAVADGTNWFLKFESFYGIDRRVFKKLDPNEVEQVVQRELSENGETRWPFIVHILKARKFVLENHNYELNRLDEETYQIVGVDPAVKGYYTIDFRFRGPTEAGMLKDCLKETDDAPTG